MKKSLVLNSVVAVLAVLMLSFMACDYAGIDAFYFLNFLESGVPAEYVALAVFTLLFLLAVCLLIVTAVLRVLVDCKVIKNEKFAKAMKVASLVLTVLALAFAVVVMICLLVIGASLGWAMIVSLVLAVAALVLVILNRK